MRDLPRAHTDDELRRLIADGLEGADEVTLKTELFEGKQLARLVREFDCDFDFSRDYEYVTLRRSVPASAAEAA